MSGDFDTPSAYDNTFAGKNVVNPPPCSSMPSGGSPGDARRKDLPL